MKKILIMTLLALVGISFTSCGKKVSAGYVGVKVYLLGTSKGVDHQELGVGRYWIGINEELYLFPTFQQNYVWTKNTDEGSPNDESLSFQTNEGMKVEADVGISYHIDPKKVSVLFQKFRKGVDEITDIYLRNYVRDSLNKIAGNYPIESVYGAGKAELIEQVQQDVARQVAPYGIIIDKLYWIGELRLPPTVVDALNAKVQATQNAQKMLNEVAEAKAEAEKQIAKAKGEAEALKEKNKAITPALLEYERIKTQQMAITKWDGHLPSTMIPGAATPILNLK